MLGILRRAFSFSDFTRHHPKEPVPGDMLDASFDALIQRISELEVLISGVLRSDGDLRNETVSFDTFKPNVLRHFDEKLAKTAEILAKRVLDLAYSAENAQNRSILAEETATQAAALSQIAGNHVLEAKNQALQRFEALGEQLIEAETLLQRSIDVRTDADDDAAYAEAWAMTSHAWAEHMPDTIPPDVIAATGVTGDHWSSRWWANYASQIVSEGLGVPGPAGPEGPQGPTGPQGPQGTPGADAAGLTDGDKGDIVVSGSGTSFMLDATVVTPAARTVLDDASVSAMLATLGGLPSSSYTAADVLSKLLTVDGAGSGLDADLLDGQSSAFFATAASVSGKLDASAYTAADVLAKIKTVDGNASGLDADLLDGNDSAFFATASSVSGKENTIAAGTTAQYWRGDKSWQTLDKAAVGLANVDNTSDANKPVSTAQQTALDGKVSDTGDTMTGDLTIDKTAPTFNLVKAAGQLATILFKTGANSRWGIDTLNNAEGGANAGSDLRINRYNDAGGYIDTALSINRATGNMTTKNLLAAGYLASSGAAPQLYLDKTAGNEAQINFRTGTTLRWKVYSDNSAESAGNGSHFRITRYDDAGASLGDAFNINRSTGVMTINNGALTGTVSVPSLSTAGGVRAHNATAVPAGGTAGAGVTMSSTTNFGTFFGSGAPTLSAAKGSQYLRSDSPDNNSRTYINNNGSTGWTALSAISVGTSAPSSPATNDVWIDTT